MDCSYVDIEFLFERKFTLEQFREFRLTTRNQSTEARQIRVKRSSSRMMGTIQWALRAGLSTASMAAAVHTLDDFSLLELGLGHAAHAVRSKVGVPSLDTLQTAQVLVALLLPLGD